MHANQILGGNFVNYLIYKGLEERGYGSLAYKIALTMTQTPQLIKKILGENWDIRFREFPMEEDGSILPLTDGISTLLRMSSLGCLPL